MDVFVMERSYITSSFTYYGVEKFESKMDLIRNRFARKSVFSTFILDPAISPKLLELFFIYFSGLSKAVVDPVQDWIKRSSSRCKELGITEIGETLRLLDYTEDHHPLLMHKDGQKLAARWNRRYSPKLDAEEIIASTNTLGIRTYTELREGITNSDAPFRQLAIEYEIERVGIDYGLQWIEQCALKLGNDYLDLIDFESEYEKLNFSRAITLQDQLEAFLASHPEYALKMVEAAEAALQAFDLFIGDCLIISMAHSNQYV